MSSDLILPQGYILQVADSASHRYKEYQIPKRTGGFRTIHHPSKELKLLQRWLLREVIEKLPVHNSATAYRRGYSIVKNAERHVGSKYLLRMDLADFFPSLADQDIRKLLVMNKDLFSEWCEEDTELFCRLVCKYGILTIGAPSSPALSNALCWKMDVDLASLAFKYGVIYSRYADDLFFSTSTKGILVAIEKEVGKLLSELDYPQALQVNLKKTHHSSKRNRRRVTGVTLGSDGRLSLGRAMKRRIRTLIFRLESLTEKERQSLAGLLAYCMDVEPDFINKLIQKYKPERVRQARSPS
ncbi:MAG: retron St85 family RNA-directed DNA polymerase [Candidatus Binatia bacterium]